MKRETQLLGEGYFTPEDFRDLATEMEANKIDAIIIEESLDKTMFYEQVNGDNEIIIKSEKVIKFLYDVIVPVETETIMGLELVKHKDTRMYQKDNTLIVENIKATNDDNFMIRVYDTRKLLKSGSKETIWVPKDAIIIASQNTTKAV